MMIKSLLAVCAFSLGLHSAMASGSKSYVTLFAKKDHWEIKQTEERIGKFPNLKWQGEFAHESDALQWVQKNAPNDIQVNDSLKTESTAIPTTSILTEVPGVSLWKVTQQWNWEWEKRYGDWIQSSVDVHFFQTNNLLSDCADLAYTLRWIFSRMNGLPAANHLTGSGLLFTQDSMKAEWLKLPTNPNWQQDLRFRAALEYVLDLTYTHSLLHDSYPIEISPRSFLVGTHHLEIRPVSGHTMVVQNVDLSDDAKNPLTVFYSNDPRIVRELYQSGYWRMDQPKKDLGGFLRFLWPHPVQTTASGQIVWDLMAARDQPYYSEEEYSPDFMGQQTSFDEAVLAHLNPKLDYHARLQSGIHLLHTQIDERAQAITDGFAVCSKHPEACAPGTPGDDDWGTVARDARLKDIFNQILSLLNTVSPHDSSFSQIWENELRKPALVLDGQNYSLGEVYLAWTAQTYNSSPLATPASRWGVDAQSFLTSLNLQLEKSLNDRNVRIKNQGQACQDFQANLCTEGTSIYKTWNTFDLDGSIQNLFFYYTDFCKQAPSDRCTELKKMAANLSVVDPTLASTNASELNFLQWSDRAVWLNSDPRVAIEDRWGEKNSRYQSHVLDSGNFLAVDQQGIAFSCQNSSTCSLWNAILGSRLVAPTNMNWVSYNPASQVVQPSSAQTNPQANSPFASGLAVTATADAGTIQVWRNLTSTAPEKIYEHTFAGAGLVAQSAPQVVIHWLKPGTLIIVRPTVIKDTPPQTLLVDLNQTPVYENSELSAPLVVAESSNNWISKTVDPAGHFHSSLSSYGKDGIQQQPLQSDGIDSVVFQSLIGTKGRYLCGNLGTESKPMGRSFLIDLNSHVMRIVTEQDNIFSPNYDGSSGVILHYGSQSPMTESVTVGSDTSGPTLVSRTKLAAGYGSPQMSENATYYSFFNFGEHIQFLAPMRYKNAQWTTFELLADEDSIMGSNYATVSLKLKNGGERVRSFDNAQPLFESATSVSLNAVQPNSQAEAPWIAAQFQDLGSSFFQPGEHLRPFITLPSPASSATTLFSDPFGMNRAAYFSQRGLVVKLDENRTLWIDIAPDTSPDRSPNITQ